MSRLALVFGAQESTFRDVVLSLQTDALSAGADISVLGVHEGWLRREKVTRALVVDDRGDVVLRDFSPPLRPDHVWVLHLPSVGERELHRSISSVLKDVPQINPYPASERADDKAETHGLWDGLPTPAWKLLKRGSPTLEGDLEGFLRKHGRVVVLPNHGTEGRDVECFGAGEGRLWEHIDHIMSYDDVLLREERGELTFWEEDVGLLRFCLRVHVAWDGGRFVAESGFVQVAPSEDFPVASRGRGGRISSLTEVLRNLRFRGGRWVPNEGDVSLVREVSERAADALNEGLKEGEMLLFMGLDIVCDVDDGGRLLPVLLEANPRPAGLQHSRFLGLEHDELFITSALFRYIGR
ncbi:MAG TPA: hypothetical protein EYP61_02105 [Candidatus Latescibacteria bacterium]|nr:hypothetical protein [Candidatus Latescibacterota bacterium]